MDWPWSVHNVNENVVTVTASYWCNNWSRVAEERTDFGARGPVLSLFRTKKKKGHNHL